MSKTAIVAGFGKFPYDMLRYDACFPATPEDAQKIGSGFLPSENWTIRVRTHKKEFTVDRWNSFGVAIKVEN